MSVIRGIVIGASQESLYAIKKCKEMGVYVYAIDGSPTAPGLVVADQGDIIDISNVSAVLEYVKEKSIRFVIPVPIGRYLTTIGKVNDALGLLGISYHAAELCVDKWKFHQSLQENNLRPIECYHYDNSSLDVQNTKFPVIAKPRFGSGSKGVVEIGSLLESQKFLSIISDEYLLEEKFIGEEFGIDAQILQGELQVVLIRKKENTPPPNMQAVGYFSQFDTVYKGDLFADSEQLLKAVAQELSLDNCLLHADLLVSETDFCLVEVSGRPSGHNLHNKFTIYATEFDMVENFIHFQQTGLNQLCSPKKNCVCIHYFDLSEGIVTSVPSVEDVLATISPVEYQCNIAKGDILSTVKEGPSLMERGYFIIDGIDCEEIEHKIKTIKSMFQIE